jgi:hypothetical protein
MSDQTPTTRLHPPADGPVAGATLLIEAPSAEEALTQLHDQLGASARIVEVRRIARGGIGGFFARELVELHAAPGDAATTPPRSPVAAPASPGAPAAPVSEAPAAPAAPVSEAPAADVGPAVSPIDRLLRVEAEADDVVDFATFLRGQMDDAPTAPTGTGADLSSHEALLARATAAARLAVRSATGDLAPGGVVDPATDQVIGTPVMDPTTHVEVPAVEPTPVAAPAADAAADLGIGSDLAGPTATSEPGPAWSVATLVKLGMPADLVRGLEVAAPADDVAWTAALAGALRPVCRPLPNGKSLLVGPRARSIANGLGIATTTVGQPIRSRAAAVAAPVGRGAAGRAWLERARRGRWLHLVVGGSGWRELLHLDPLAVSWASTEDVPEAIRLATDLGLVLGAGPLDRQVRRARPLDVALAVRSLLPVTDEVRLTGAAADGSGQL